MKNEIGLTIELTGIAESIAGAREIELAVPHKSSYNDVVERLADLYPELVGILIEEDRRNFLSSNLFIINDQMTLPVFEMDKRPEDGYKLSLLSVMTGG